MKKLIWIALFMLWGDRNSKSTTVSVTPKAPVDYKLKTKQYVEEYNELVYQLSEKVEE